MPSRMRRKRRSGLGVAGAGAAEIHLLADRLGPHTGRVRAVRVAVRVHRHVRLVVPERHRGLANLRNSQSGMPERLWRADVSSIRQRAVAGRLPDHA